MFKNIKSHAKLITISFSTILIIGLFIFIIVPFPIAKAKEKAPTQPFNLSFSLDNPLIESSDELMARIILEIPNELPTPVNLVFTISRDLGEEVYREKVNVTIVNNVIMDKSFEGLRLPRGRYTLVLDVVYNNDIFGDFKQEFRIGRDSRQITGEVVAYVGDFKNWSLFGFLSIILIAFLILHRVFRKEEEDWEKLFNRGKNK